MWLRLGFGGYVGLVSGFPLNGAPSETSRLAADGEVGLNLDGLLDFPRFVTGFEGDGDEVDGLGVAARLELHLLGDDARIVAF